MPKFNDLTGQKFGRLTVIGLTGEKKSGSYEWWVKCSCDRDTEPQRATTSHLNAGRKLSCGCLRDEAVSAHATRHGQAKDYRDKEGNLRADRKTKLYITWCSMKYRCTNEKAPNYEHYGGRGITVCDRWMESFEAFAEDMGNPPTRKHSIDRINNDGNYEPGNCRWATQKEQLENRRIKV